MMIVKWCLLAVGLQLTLTEAIFSESNNSISPSNQLSFDNICKAKARPGKKNTGQYRKECIRSKRFSKYKPNYTILKSSKIVDDKTDISIEFNFSFKYLLTEPDCVSEYIDYDTVLADIPQNDLNEISKCVKSYKSRHVWFLKYTGKFDFYAFSKPSSPVINRLSNPGLHYREYIKSKCEKKSNSFRCKKKYLYVKWIDLSIEHRSNGQTIDYRVKNNQRFKTDIEYEKNYQGFKDYNYFDYLSRSSNYARLETKLTVDLSENNLSTCYKILKCFSMWASIKIYEKKSLEFDVNWGNSKGKNAKIELYERYNVILQNTLGIFRFGIDYTFGDEFLYTDSADIFLSIKSSVSILNKKYEFPLYFRIHSGPMSTLSNYTKDELTYGFGMIF